MRLFLHQYSCLIIGTLILAFAHPQHLENDIDVNYKDDSRKSVFNVGDEDFEVIEDVVLNRIDGSSGLVKLFRGCRSVDTFVNRIFRYEVPKDAFEGNVRYYKFSDVPSWLQTTGGSVLEGVPSTADLGDHYIKVVSFGPNGQVVSDRLLVTVNTSADSERKFKCHSDVNVLSIKVKGPLSPRNKFQLIKEASKMFTIPLAEITLSLASNSDSELETSSVFSDNQDASRSPMDQQHDIYLLRLNLGCNRKTKTKLYQQTLKKLNEMVGVPVVGWFFNQVDPVTNRVRREIDFSGDYILDNDYEYNYDDDYFNLGKASPDKSATVVTPVLSEAPQTTAYPDEPLLVSPKFNVVPLSTPVYIPVKPTKLVLESSPTVGPKTDYPFKPIEPTGLESSLLTHPTTSADYTTPLTRLSSAFSGPTRVVTAPIEATSVPVDQDKSTEYVVKNFPPRIQNRIPKQAWTAGMVYRMGIPDETFTDFEDGRTKNLTLVLKDENGAVFGRGSWIQFDPSTQEIYALPLEKHIGRYDFRLEAIDKGRKSAIDFLEISVRQHSQARIFHHQFSAVLKMEKKYEYVFAYALDWQVKAAEKIAALFQDTVSHINIRNISIDPVQISWTNVSLVNSLATDCPKKELERLTKVMLSGHGSEPTRTARRVFLPEFQLKKIHSQFYDACEPLFHHGRHDSGSSGANVHPFTPMERPDGGGVTQHENTAPIFRNQIDQLTADAGHLYRYQVPDTTCYDMEDGNSRNLKMRILTIDLSPPAPDSWLQFDSANQEFYGIPLQDDVGRREYLLECLDKGGESVSDALIVEVRESASFGVPQPALFTLTLDTPYEAFMSSGRDKARFIERLGRAFGDPRPARNVAVTAFKRGSVRVEWVNASLPNDPCPFEEVQRLRHIMTDSNGRLRPEFKNVFLPDFRVTDGGSITPSGSCLAGDTPTHLESPGDLPGSVPTEDEVASPSSGTEDALLTFIIPAVIIALMLFLSALIACCLYRRRRYGKMHLLTANGGGDSDRNTFVSKGIPVIFAEELDDHRRPEEANAKSPVIMKDEKPPLPPPEYQRGTPPPRSNDRNRPASADLNSSSDDAPYHRPPPLTASNGGGARTNLRPHPPPAYRKTPTYVPP